MAGGAKKVRATSRLAAARSIMSPLRYRCDLSAFGHPPVQVMLHRIHACERDVDMGVEVVTCIETRRRVAAFAPPELHIVLKRVHASRCNVGISHQIPICIEERVWVTPLPPAELIEVCGR